jgi:hypothetical protein
MRRRLPRFGLHRALFGLGRGNHLVFVVILVVIVFALFMAVRNGRRGR